MGSGKALYDREHAGGAVARDEAKLDSLINSEGSHDVRLTRPTSRIAKMFLSWGVLAPGSRRISKVEKENVSSPKQRFPASAPSLDPSRPSPSISVLHVRLGIQWCSPSSSWSPLKLSSIGLVGPGLRDPPTEAGSLCASHLGPWRHGISVGKILLLTNALHVPQKCGDTSGTY
jgi:hypothetical protein